MKEKRSIAMLTAGLLLVTVANLVFSDNKPLKYIVSLIGVGLLLYNAYALLRDKNNRAS